jgi:hypothetical protein
MAYERRQRSVRSDAHQEVHVVGENRILVDVHRASRGRLGNGIDDVFYISSTDEALPPPRMPRNVYVQAVSLVHATVLQRG